MTVHGQLSRGFKPSDAQQAFRESTSLERWRAGYTIPQIAAAYRPMVNEGTVRNDLDAVLPPSEGRRKRIKHKEPPLEPCDWLHPPAVAKATVDRPADILLSALAELREVRWASSHANAVIAALRAGDEVWLGRWEALLMEIKEVVDTLAGMHGPDAAKTLRAHVLGWREESIALLAPAVPDRPAQHMDRQTSAPPRMLVEIQQMVNQGRPVPRGLVAAKYGVSDRVVQAAVQYAMGWRDASKAMREELLKRGWTPAPDSSAEVQVSPWAMGTDSQRELASPSPNSQKATL